MILTLLNEICDINIIYMLFKIILNPIYNNEMLRFIKEYFNHVITSAGHCILFQINELD